MRVTQTLRAGLIALAAIVGLSLANPAHAGEGTIEITWIKGGWFFGGSAGSGVLNFQGRSYPLSIGGLSGGLTFGAAKATMWGQVHNINSPDDIEGAYGSAGAGVAVGPEGINSFILTNTRVQLELEGRQQGLMFNADFNGFVIGLK